jgi:hypothetical protein
MVSCEKEQNDSYFIFKNNVGLPITQDTIKLSTLTDVTTYIDIYYKESDPKIIQEVRGVDEQNIIDITDSSIVELLSHGWSGKEGFKFRKLKILTNISDLNSPFGSSVKITSILDNGQSKSVVYLII